MRKQPEDYYKVTITALLVTVEHPEIDKEQILWKDIQEIKLINTDYGPCAPDIWLALLGKDSGCLIPMGANGYDEVFQIVSKYKGFNFENVVKSMTCTDNVNFVLWEK